MIPLRAEWLKSEPVSVLSKLSFGTGASFADDRSRSIEARECKAVSLTCESGRYVVPERALRDHRLRNSVPAEVAETNTILRDFL